MPGCNSGACCDTYSGTCSFCCEHRERDAFTNCGVKGHGMSCICYVIDLNVDNKIGPKFLFLEWVDRIPLIDILDILILNEYIIYIYTLHIHVQFYLFFYIDVDGV